MQASNDRLYRNYRLHLRNKLNIVRESKVILRKEFAKADLDKSVSQYFTVLTGVRSVGVMGDERTYSYNLAYVP